MQQNKLYFVIGALVVIVIGLVIHVVREESKPEGVELRIDDSGRVLTRLQAPQTPPLGLGLGALSSDHS